MTTYFSSNALLSQRSSGYKGTAYALSELVDNSFDAEAKECRIIVVTTTLDNKKDEISEILIADDGKGMSDEQLQNSLQFGGTTNDNIDSMVKTKKIGKFGFGLPSASISQCKNVKVISWTEKNKYRQSTLDLQELLAQKTIEIPPIQEIKLPSYFADIGAVMNSSHGTIVSWKTCDRLSHSRAKTILDNAEQLIGRIFRHYLKKGKKVSLFHYKNSQRTQQYIKDSEKWARVNDPLFLTSDAVISEKIFNEAQKSGAQEDYFKKFSTSKVKSKPTNVRLEDKCFIHRFEWRGKSYAFKITTSVVHQDIQKPGVRDGGQTEVGKFYARKQNQSISFVRSDREIATGAFRGLYNPNDTKARWWTVEISFTADADDLLGVHVNKQGIDFRDTKKDSVDDDFHNFESNLVRARTQLWIELTSQITDCVRAAKKVVNSQATEGPGPDDGPIVIPGATGDTETATADTDGERKGIISKEDKNILIKRLGEKYPSLTKADIENAVEYFDTSKKASTILYVANEDSPHLWTTMKVSGFLIVLINTRHLFYEKHMHELRESGDQSHLSAIELFIGALAIEEGDISKDEERHFIEYYTQSVSMHLKRYLSSLNDKGSNS